MTDQGHERLDTQFVQLRSEITSLLGKWVVAVVVALLAAAGLGWWFYLSPRIETAFGVPSGGVLAFDQTECPDGWNRVDEAVGRTIVGSSATPIGNLDQDGTTIPSPKLREEGGQVSVKLEHGNLPSIPVAVPWRYDLATLSSGTNDVRVMRGLGRDGATAGVEDILEAGNRAAPIANLPPYLALLICRKG